jgi:hypothetical protein
MTIETWYRAAPAPPRILQARMPEPERLATERVSSATSLRRTTLTLAELPDSCRGLSHQITVNVRGVEVRE